MVMVDKYNKSNLIDDATKILRTVVRSFLRAENFGLHMYVILQS